MKVSVIYTLLSVKFSDITSTSLAIIGYGCYNTSTEFSTVSTSPTLCLITTFSTMMHPGSMYESLVSEGSFCASVVLPGFKC